MIMNLNDRLAPSNGNVDPGASSTFRLSIRSVFVPGRSPEEKIMDRRVVFRWLPIFSSNDLTAGSWYFVYGSIIFTFVSFVPLFNVNSPFWPKESFGNFSPAELIIMSCLFIASGIFFTIGSYAFVRALREDEHKTEPLCNCSQHTSTDELLGSWLYFLAMVPYPPYVAFYLSKSPGDPSLWVLLAATIAAVYAMYLFVLATYPNYSQASESSGPAGLISAMSTRPQCCACLPRCLQCVCGADTKLAVHVQNDWLVGCWIFFVGSALLTLALVIRIVQSVRNEQDALIVLYAIETFDFLLFTIGCAYFCAGSYPMREHISRTSSSSNSMSGLQSGLKSIIADMRNSTGHEF